jgi:hypothetical protein
MTAAQREAVREVLWTWAQAGAWRDSCETKIIDSIARIMALQWRPVADLELEPKRHVVAGYWFDGDLWVQGIIHTTSDSYRGYTHYAELPAPPKEETRDAKTT